MTYKLLPTILAGLLASAAVHAGEKAHWDYSDHAGPKHWGELDPAYATCASGKNQSPINLTGMIEGELPELKVDYTPGANEVINNGHTVEVKYAPGSTMTVDGHKFELKQLHFHTPSENTIEGRHLPMEAHFVHADKEGQLAVIAIMYESGKVNPELEKAWQYMPSKVGETQVLAKPVNAASLMPSDLAYYRFNGSLTTPPCSEGVNWYVMKSFDSASQEQIDAFDQAMMHHANNRPVQPINARVVIQ